MPENEINCEACNGFGDNPDTLEPCPACKGLGYITSAAVPFTSDHAAALDAALTAFEEKAGDK